MDRRDAPQTDEGWYALHDFRTIDWDRWRDAPSGDRDRAIAGGQAYLEEVHAVTDAPDGGSAVFAITGHKADLLVFHLRPTLTGLNRLERQFEGTDFARYTDQPASYVSVTEVSGYMDVDLSGGIDAIDDDGLRKYVQSRLYPTIPDADRVCFYPMDKRRDPTYNWYDLPFAERAKLMSGHGDIGREYAGKVTQIITGSVGLDDHEWGITLFADDLVDVKHLLAEMRFDPSSSRYAEFGTFYVGHRIHPDDLGAFLAGETVPSLDGTPAEDANHPHGSRAPEDGSQSTDVTHRLDRLGVDHAGWADTHVVITYSDAEPTALHDQVDGMRKNFEHYDRHVHTSVETGSDRAAVVSVWQAAEAADTASGFLADLPGVTEQVDGPLGRVDTEPDGGDTTVRDESVTPTKATTDTDIRKPLADLDVYAGQPHGEDVYAMVVYSEAEIDELEAAVAGLREEFDEYATHIESTVYRARDRPIAAVVSLWETDPEADTAGGDLSALPGVVAEGGTREGFGTMGMFYTVEPSHRQAFVDQFGEVVDHLSDLEGHRESTLFINVEDENDMFIASQWRAREPAMEFFGSDTFAETISWGREVLADRPRHVFLV